MNDVAHVVLALAVVAGQVLDRCPDTSGCFNRLQDSPDVVYVDYSVPHLVFEDSEEVSQRFPDCRFRLCSHYKILLFQLLPIMFIFAVPLPTYKRRTRKGH